VRKREGRMTDGGGQSQSQARSLPAGADVWLAACDVYEAAVVRRAIDRLGDGCGLGDRARGRAVFCKVNAATGGSPRQARATHPEVVAALVDYLRRRGAARVYVGDSSAVYGHSRAALEAAGIARAARETGARVVDIDALTPRRLPLALQPAVYTGDLILDTPVLVSAAKLKTHSLAGYSGALKNLMGVVSGAGKARLHQARGAGALWRLLAELARAVDPDFGLVDGVVGLEGNGPSDGRPRHVGLLAASTDLVALDTTVCRLMGLPPAGVPLPAAAAALGLGTDDPERIVLRGDTVQPLQPPLAPPAGLFRLGERLPVLGRLLYRLRERATTPGVQKALCTGCGHCTASCPAAAATLVAGKARISPARCRRCFHCLAACPQGAVRSVARPWLRPLVAARLRALGLG